MVVTNKSRIEQEQEQNLLDEGWWTSVLADEERYSSMRRLRPADSSIPKMAVEQPPVQHVPEIEPKSESDEKPAVDWEYADSIYKQDQIIALIVNGFNRGGLLVEGNRLYGFVPYSHLVDMTCQSDAERERFLATFVGKELRLKVIECVPSEGRVVFSERAARADAGRRTQLFSSLEQGQIITGEVTNITDFGVFIDLGGVEGLIHISELSWGRVVHPSHILTLGQKVQVQVIDILPERCRIALSLKRLLPNPWENAYDRYAVNDVVHAIVTSVASFGVFARLEEGLEGLVHVSEMDLDGATVRETFSEGQRLNVRILHIDPIHQRLGLSLRLSGSAQDD